MRHCHATLRCTLEHGRRYVAHAQVNMLLTLEEFCGEEGIFEGMGEQGHLFEPMFGQVRALCTTLKAASA